MNHLSEGARQFMDKSDEERILACRRRIFMVTPEIIKTYDMVSDLIAAERSDSNIGLVIVGPPGAGKTTLGKKIAEVFEDSPHGKVLYIDLANYAEDMDLRAILHRALGVVKTPRNPYVTYDNVKEACRLIRDKKIVGVVFDESHDIGRAVSARRGEANLTALRSFSNGDYGLTIILIGIKKLFRVLAPDDQLTSRFTIRRVTMEDWKSDSELLASFLTGFVSHLPLKKESIVDGVHFMATVVRLRGNTRAITDLLRACAIEAIRNGQECITQELFEAMHAEFLGQLSEEDIILEADIGGGPSESTQANLKPHRAKSGKQKCAKKAAKTCISKSTAEDTNSTNSNEPDEPIQPEPSHDGEAP
ncbi:TniB family NTP-binding protein [Pseudomonas japonica]|uniref:TniB protein n=1 Tax=Pseudomonas japonica TaxID=256466 RepID=A0A239C3X9_9PSED|nr:TniB family NTP-binding protein [Pseudomonas japonica]SNS14378.1 TniB protein [Pseudomonas japonica]